MATIRFSNGQTVNFNGTPTQKDIEEIAAQMQGGTTQQTQQPQENPNGATFRSTPDDTGLQAGLKSAGNVPSSGFNLAKAVGTAVVNPLETLEGIRSAARGGGGKLRDATASGIDKLTGSKVGSVALGAGKGKKEDDETIGALGQVFNDRFGTSFGDKKFSVDDMLKRLQVTATEDPVGFGADIAGILSGGAATIGKTAQLGQVASKVARVATAPVRVPAKAAVKTVKDTTKFGVSQATGLTPETLKTITGQTKAFDKAKAAGTTRVDLAEDVFGALTKANDELSDLGKGYNTIRASGNTATLPDNWAVASLEKYGLGFEDGVVIADRGSRTRNVADINKIQSFMDNWGDAKTFTADEYLNMRHDLAEIAKFDQAGSNVAREFATNLREGTLNSDQVRKQIVGLKEIDNKFSTDKTFFNKLRKDFLDNKGNLKDGAASKVLNTINKANPERLERLERLYPGFTKQAQVIKAVEDVEAAMGLKVGTYLRAGVGISGALTGNLPLIISAILSTPEIAVPLLKAFGITADKAGPILKAVREFSSDINNFRTPGAVNAFVEKNYPDGVPAGLSTKAVITPEQKGLIAKELEDYDAGFFDVKQGGATKSIAPDSVDERIAEIQAKNSGGKFTDAEAIEVKELLSQKGIDIDTPETPTKKAPNLLEEAKGKTLDEFVKAQGKPVYHGTNADFTEFDIKKIGSQTDDGLFGRGFYFATSERMAKQAPSGGASKVMEIFIDPKAIKNLYSPRRYKTIKETAEYLDVPESILKESKDGVVPYEKYNTQYTNRLKEKGWDGVAIIRGSGGSEAVIFDPKNIKTRTQLEDIWNKANK